MKQLELARPYAKAAFEFARDKKKLAEWEKALKLLSQMVHAHELREYVQHPMVGQAQVAETLIDCLKSIGKISSKPVQNFIRTIAYFDKILVLPEIFSIFETYMAEEKSVVRAVATSFEPLTKAQETKLIKALKTKFGQDVSLTCQTDKTVLGGVKVQVDDWVLDNTVQSRLTRLTHSLGDHSL